MFTFIVVASIAAVAWICWTLFGPSKNSDKNNDGVVDHKDVIVAAKEVAVEAKEVAVKVVEKVKKARKPKAQKR